MYRKIAERQGIELVYAPAPNRILGMVDQQRIMQVLDNLLRNALQFTPEGGLISISTDQEEMEGRSWAVLTVADTGYGIPDHEIPHIFERFFRGEKPRLMQVSGTGLGLAIVQEIVALHGGWVQVDSRVGLGSAFTVWVPADGVTDGIKEESRIYEHLQLNE
jgi:signal transduction histidine kinase